MSMEQEIEQVLFNIGKTIHIHKIDNDHSVIEIDYRKHLNDIMEIINRHKG
jgi:hypothetical protein